MLDKHIPNIFVRWSGIVVKRSWEDILKTEFTNACQLTGFDKKFGKKYSYKKYQDCEFGIDPNINFKKSCIGILTDLNIYKNIKAIEKFFTKEQLVKYKKHLNNFVDGKVSLEVIQIGLNTLGSDFTVSSTNILPIDLKNISMNIIFRSVNIYLSIVIDKALSKNTNNLIIKSIKLGSELPLNVSNNNTQQILRLQIDDVQQPQ